MNPHIKLYLAPMEGVVDFTMRRLLTALGGIDVCTTEFVRVTNQLLPDSVFYRYCPELKTKSLTPSGTPVIVQLLGGDPNALADNAAKAYQLGAIGIDLNFGCPAKLVNRHDGGAALLRCPDRISAIVSAVRKALPAHIPVTAKIRLGFDRHDQCLENSLAAESGGAQHLTVHCRTKLDMYQPPAYWDWIPRIKEQIKIPIVANGEIWNLSDLLRCQKETGCDQFMIGRGALRDPFIFQKIKSSLQLNMKLDLEFKANTKISDSTKKFGSPSELLLPFFDANSEDVSQHYAQAKTKQMLRNLIQSNEDLRPLFDQVKAIQNPELFRQVLSLNI